MTAYYASWFAAVAVAAVMLAFAMRVSMLTPPQPKRRCAACGRLVRRGRVCECARRETRDA
jgi:hypothetical protein